MILFLSKKTVFDIVGRKVEEEMKWEEGEGREQRKMGVGNVRRMGIVLGICNALVFLLGSLLISHTYRLCNLRSLLPFVAVSFCAVVRILVMLQTAFAQQSAATLILLDDHNHEDHLLLRFQRRVRNHQLLYYYY